MSTTTSRPGERKIASIVVKYGVEYTHRSGKRGVHEIYDRAEAIEFAMVLNKSRPDARAVVVDQIVTTTAWEMIRPFELGQRVVYGRKGRNVAVPPMTGTVEGFSECLDRVLIKNDETDAMDWRFVANVQAEES